MMIQSRRRLTHLLFVAIAAVVLASTTLSAFELNRYFSDDMVLQRDKTITIWGTGNKDETVTVTFAPRQGSGQAGHTKSAKTDDSGRWVVTLAPMPVSDKGQDLVISSSINNQKSTIKNVLIGDVFLFARQSSIDVSLGTTPEGKQAAQAFTANDTYRFIHIKTSPSRTPLNSLKDDATNGWQGVDTTTALGMSAAAFYLGRDLAKDATVPIGIVDLNMGYHFAGAWMSEEALKKAAGLEVEGAADVRGGLQLKDAYYNAWDTRHEGFVPGKPHKGMDKVPGNLSSPHRQHVSGIFKWQVPERLPAVERRRSAVAAE